MPERVYRTNIQTARLAARNSLSMLILSHLVAIESARPALTEEEHDAAAYLLDLLTDRYALMQPASARALPEREGETP